MYILDAKLLKCNLLQAMVEKRQRVVQRMTLTAGAIATWSRFFQPHEEAAKKLFRAIKIDGGT